MSTPKSSRSFFVPNLDWTINPISVIALAVSVGAFFEKLKNVLHWNNGNGKSGNEAKIRELEARLNTAQAALYEMQGSVKTLIGTLEDARDRLWRLEASSFKVKDDHE